MNSKPLRSFIRPPLIYISDLSLICTIFLDISFNIHALRIKVTIIFNDLSLREKDRYVGWKVY